MADTSAPESAPLFDSLFDRVATAPISWGVCEVPGWGHQLSPDRVLSEMRSLGFTHTELGSEGWLPIEVEPLKATLAEHDLGLLAAFVSLVLHDPAQADDAMARAEATADLLAAAGARYFNTAPVTSYDWEPRRPYTDAEWDQLATGLEQIEEICRARGLEQVVHEHVGCVIETADEVKRMLDSTSVSLVLDTGHLAVGGMDPLAVVESYPDRIGLVHLKDTTMAVAEQLNRGELTLMEAVQAGLFPALGRGDLDLAEIVIKLNKLGFDGWYVIEQDCALTSGNPAPGEGPMADVAASVDYLKALCRA